MSRPNRNRTIGAERLLAKRMATERDLRGWTNKDLAAAMTEAGCPIHATAIWKIEHAQPPRKIYVDELQALSVIWAIPISRLLEESHAKD